ncbi:MAG: hypothetical protein HYT87_19010 [Nitrospirae bacterium]|nr:hypothetical protein [Nitrospirota bacterium]
MKSSCVARGAWRVVFTLLTAYGSLLTFTACPATDLPSLGAEASIQALADPEIVPADGSSISTITATIRRKGGEFALDGTEAVFATSIGQVSSTTVPTKGGRAITSVASLQTGRATVTIRSENLSTRLEITFVPAGQVAAIRGSATSVEINVGQKELPISSSTVLTALVKDLNAQPVSDGTEVVFSTEGTNTVNPPKAKTVAGIARTTFTAGSVSSEFDVAAQSGGASSRLRIKVLAARVASIEFLEPENFKTPLGVIGSGRTETLLIQAKVLDELDRPVANGTPVTFSLFGVGGGETLQPGAPAAAATLSGIATTRLRTGKVAGAVQVQAAIDLGSQGTASAVSPTIQIRAFRTTVGRFLVVPNPDKLNLAGFLDPNLLFDVNVAAGDRYNNPVEDLLVAVISESGVVPTPEKNVTGATGQVGIKLQTGPMWPVDLAPACLDRASAVYGDSCLSPEDGLVSLTAYTSGEEGYFDVNGNGAFDLQEDIFCVEIGKALSCPDPLRPDTCTTQAQALCNAVHDISEPFVDSNDNGARDVFETFIDANENGIFDDRNGRWNASTFVWDRTKILFTSKPAVKLISLADKTATIYAGDQNGNPLTGGSRIDFKMKTIPGSSIGFVVGQTTSFTVKSTSNPGTQTFHSLQFNSDPKGATLDIEVTSKENGDLTTRITF